MLRSTLLEALLPYLRRVFFLVDFVVGFVPVLERELLRVAMGASQATCMPGVGMSRAFGISRRT
jgi:hypothetical protein